jgi:hypothetical protein
LPLLVRLLRESFLLDPATIYSVGGSDNEVTIKNKMAAEINPVTGEKNNFASGISLLLFYAFAIMRQYFSGNQKKPIPGVACRAIDLHVRLCLCSRVNHLSNAKIGNLNTLQLK